MRILNLVTLVFILFSSTAGAGSLSCKFTFGNSIKADKLHLALLSPSTKSILEITEPTELAAKIINDLDTMSGLDATDYIQLLDADRRLKPLTRILNRTIKRWEKSKDLGEAAGVSEYELSKISYLLRPAIVEGTGFFKQFISYRLTAEVENLLANRAEQLLIQRGLTNYFSNLGIVKRNPRADVARYLLGSWKPYLKILGSLGINLGLYHELKSLSDKWAGTLLEPLYSFQFFIPIFIPKIDLIERSKMTNEALEIYKSNGPKALVSFYKSTATKLFNTQRAAQLVGRYNTLLMTGMLILSSNFIYNDFIEPTAHYAYDKYQTYKYESLVNEVINKNNFLQSELLVKPEEVDTMAEIQDLGLMNVYEKFSKNFPDMNPHKSLLNANATKSAKQENIDHLIENKPAVPNLTNKRDLEAWVDFMNRALTTRFRSISFEIYTMKMEAEGKTFDPYSQSHLKDFDVFLNTESMFRNLDVD